MSYPAAKPRRLASAPRPPWRIACSQASRDSGSTPLPAIAPNSTALITVPLSWASLCMSNSTVAFASSFAASWTRAESKRPSAICIFSTVA